MSENPARGETVAARGGRAEEMNLCLISHIKGSRQHAAAAWQQPLILNDIRVNIVGPAGFYWIHCLPLTASHMSVR